MTITFKAKYVRTLCNREDFKMFAMEVDVKQYPELTLNSYGNIVICGDLFDLQFGIEYTITAFKEQTKYGYKVINATYDRPKDAESVKTFLYEILTFRQADTILEHYPNILDLIKEERCDEIDLRKLKGIKEKTFAKIKRKIIYNYCLIDLVSEFNGYITLSVIKHLYNQYKSVDKVKYELRKDPYKCLCKISGIGFLRADAILLEIENKEGWLFFNRKRN